MIAIDTQSSGGFKVTETTTGETFFFSALQYACKNDQIELIPAAGSNILPLSASYSELIINGNSGLGSAAAACAALDTAGLGGSKSSLFALPARGSVTVTGTPADEDTLTLNDGTNTVVFEFSGAKAAGSVTFIDDATPAKPSDGDTVILDAEGDFEKTFEFNIGRKASVVLSFEDDGTAENLVDGNILTFEGKEETVTFIFLDTPADESGYAEVEIGASAAATMAAFITKFNASVEDYTATAADPADNTCTISADAVGSDFTIDFATNATYIAFSAETAGLNNGENISDPANIGVGIMSTVATTAAEFVRLWNANVPDFTATQGTGGNTHVCSIAAKKIGVLYNVTLTSESDTITITAPTGGVDSGTNLTAPNIEVPIGETTYETAENLTDAINEVSADGDLWIYASRYEAVVSLTNKITGSAGNEDITTDSSAVTVAGMSGGRAKTDIADILTALAALAV